MSVTIVKYKIPIDNLPNDTYDIAIADCPRNAGEILDGRLIISHSTPLDGYYIDTFEKGTAYGSVKLSLIELVDSDLEINHWCFQEIARYFDGKNEIIRYYVR